MTNQIELCNKIGLAYNTLYFVQYKDPYECPYCKSGCIIDCDCRDDSFELVLQCDGVYLDPKRGQYILFTDPDPEVQKFRSKYFELLNSNNLTIAQMNYLHDRRYKIADQEKHLWLKDVDDYIVTPHRRAWNKLPKNRHNPDKPIDLRTLIKELT